MGLLNTLVGRLYGPADPIARLFRRTFDDPVLAHLRTAEGGPKAVRLDLLHPDRFRDLQARIVGGAVDLVLGYTRGLNRGPARSGRGRLDPPDADALRREFEAVFAPLGAAYERYAEAHRAAADHRDLRKAVSAFVYQFAVQNGRLKRVVRERVAALDRRMEDALE